MNTQYNGLPHYITPPSLGCAYGDVSAIHRKFLRNRYFNEKPNGNSNGVSSWSLNLLSYSQLSSMNHRHPRRDTKQQLGSSDDTKRAGITDHV